MLTSIVNLLKAYAFVAIKFQEIIKIDNKIDESTLTPSDAAAIARHYIDEFLAVPEIRSAVMQFLIQVYASRLFAESDRDFNDCMLDARESARVFLSTTDLNTLQNSIVKHLPELEALWSPIVSFKEIPSIETFTVAIDSSLFILTGVVA